MKLRVFCYNVFCSDLSVEAFSTVINSSAWVCSWFYWPTRTRAYKLNFELCSLRKNPMAHGTLKFLVLCFYIKMRKVTAERWGYRFDL